MKTYHFSVRPMVTQFALIGMAAYSTRDSFWRDIELAGANIAALALRADRAYLKRKKGRST